MEDNDVTVVTRKGTRVTEMLQPTPQQLIETELIAARAAMGSFYTERHTTIEPTLEIPDEYEETTKNQDSVKVDKRANPQVGRAVGPKRKSDT